MPLLVIQHQGVIHRDHRLKVGNGLPEGLLSLAVPMALVCPAAAVRAGQRAVGA